MHTFGNSEFYVNLYLPWCLPLSSGGGILGEIYGEGLLYMGELNDQIMPKGGELYKRIFQ